MATKTANIYMVLRDENGDINGSTEQSGLTDDEGATVVIGLGYLPGIAAAAANGDVSVTVLTVTETPLSPTGASTTPDYDNNTQTISFTL